MWWSTISIVFIASVIQKNRHSNFDLWVLLNAPRNYFWVRKHWKPGNNWILSNTTRLTHDKSKKAYVVNARSYLRTRKFRVPEFLLHTNPRGKLRNCVRDFLIISIFCEWFFDFFDFSCDFWFCLWFFDFFLDFFQEGVRDFFEYFTPHTHLQNKQNINKQSSDVLTYTSNYFTSYLQQSYKF